MRYPKINDLYIKMLHDHFFLSLLGSILSSLADKSKSIQASLKYFLEIYGSVHRTLQLYMVPLLAVLVPLGGLPDVVSSCSLVKGRNG